ncbi:C-type lectin domain family 9 member A-like [Periophthalmus magnuspinnatus]|uniref:C-type lectin domain family 9 member A-like n=1 Tax=Periophthalmus magnuspinnatus TaxID=409849 RepID=UPI0024365AB2|nr:C-type lectin domain family 9 member A-like [Periophthalmus magnuspinnatus]
MAENVYENVAVIVGENKGLRDDEAPKRRSKVTGGRVALGVLSLLFLAGVVALIMYYNSPFKKDSEATTEMTAVAVNFTEIQTTPAQTTAAVSTCSSVAQCDEDWELNGTQCYYFSNRSLQLTWTSSKDKCQSKRGDLIKIESREEQEFLDGRVRLLMDAEDERFWIGLTDSQTEGEWLWTDGSPLNQR